MADNQQQQQEQQMSNMVPYWSNTLNYYNFLRGIWDDIKKARMAFNEASGQLSAKSLEDWYESQRILFDMLYHYLNKDSIDKIENNYTEIRQMTANQQFVALYGTLSEEAWTKIKKNLEENERTIAIEEAKNGLFLTKKRIPTEEEYFRS